jgi:prepilin-type N-terminal cleavage/methylation domain-containing protein
VAVIRTKRDRLLSRAFTLIESVISVVIVAVMVVVALTTFSGVAKARLIQKAPQDAETLGRALLTEIVQACYEDPDTPGGVGLEFGESAATRAYFDDTDDYNGWIASPPQTKDGIPLTQYEGWTRRAVVTDVDPMTISPSSVQGSGLRMIVVVVTDPAGNQTIVQALRSKYGMCEKDPIYETTFVTYAGINLQIGADASGSISSGINLMNQPIAQ